MSQSLLSIAFSSFLSGWISIFGTIVVVMLVLTAISFNSRFFKLAGLISLLNIIPYGITFFTIIIHLSWTIILTPFGISGSVAWLMSSISDSFNESNKALCAIASLCAAAMTTFLVIWMLMIRAGIDTGFSSWRALFS